VRDSVRSYYAQIRSLLRDRPDLRPYLKRCKHCRIFFFTHPRNVGRDDLRCGFGCRETHRRKIATQRSVEFHRQHKDKKRTLNRRRYLLSAKASAALRGQQPLCCGAGPPAGADPAATPILKHVRVIVSLIEGRRVELCEIVRMLAQKGRQHRMARKRRPAYGRRRIRDRGS
jgi:hypothetical protein